MGIVYKLKKDVIDFIVQKKNEARVLSCRQIAVLASEKFKIQVSKSSVNTVIKNARLSSSVGRRPQEDSRPKKFQIPSGKKKQLSDSLKKAGFEPAPSGRVVTVDKKKTPPALSDIVPQTEQQAVVASVPQKDGADAAYEKLLEYVHRWRETVHGQRGPLLKGMGFVFLKSVEWGIAGSSILGKVLKRHCQDRPFTSFERSCEMLPYLSILGARDKDDVKHMGEHALWTLNDGAVLSDVCSLLDWTKETKLSPLVSMEYGNEVGQALFNIYRFAIYLESGKCIYMDAQLASLWRGRSPDSLCSSLSRSVSLLSRSFISNNDPVMFFALGDESLPLEEAVEMMMACGSADRDPIKRIVALDGEDNAVVEFSIIPLRKRSFCVGVWPWQKGFSEFAKYVYMDGYQPFYSKHLDAIFHFKEVAAAPIWKNSYLYENIRVISVLAQDKNKPIVVILTNHMEMPAEDLAQAFILRWPNLDQGPAGGIFQRVNFMQYVDINNVKEFSDVSGRHDAEIIPESHILSLSYDLGQILQKRCREQFSLELTHFDIDGYCIVRDNVRYITLSLRTDHPRLREIRRAVLAINESVITDFDGHLLMIQCDTQKNPEQP